tara:strand:- start:230 stop:415 length:186 start_codon:yes stop_codon:yes gene_type:complete
MVNTSMAVNVTVRVCNGVGAVSLKATAVIVPDIADEIVPDLVFAPAVDSIFSFILTEAVDR